jgi:hypothetical protein
VFATGLGLQEAVWKINKIPCFHGEFADEYLLCAELRDNIDPGSDFFCFGAEPGLGCCFEYLYRSGRGRLYEDEDRESGIERFRHDSASTSSAWGT